MIVALLLLLLLVLVVVVVVAALGFGLKVGEVAEMVKAKAAWVTPLRGRAMESGPAGRSRVGVGVRVGVREGVR